MLKFVGNRTLIALGLKILLYVLVGAKILQLSEAIVWIDQSLNGLIVLFLTLKGKRIEGLLKNED